VIDMDTLTALSTITGGIESFGEAGQLMAAASGYKAQAGLLDVSAKGALAGGDLQASQVRQAGDKFIARQRAMYAKAGVKFTGSPASVWAETEKKIQLDVVNTKLNAAARANEIGFEALQMRMAAGNARTAAWSKASQGLLKIGTAMAMQGGSGQGMSIRGGGEMQTVTTRGNTVYNSTTVA
jgi:hypothetical protein